MNDSAKSRWLNDFISKSPFQMSVHVGSEADCPPKNSLMTIITDDRPIIVTEYERDAVEHGAFRTSDDAVCFVALLLNQAPTPFSRLELPEKQQINSRTYEGATQALRIALGRAEHRHSITFDDLRPLTSSGTDYRVVKETGEARPYRFYDLARNPACPLFSTERPRNLVSFAYWKANELCPSPVV